jgi:transketolase
MKQRVIHVMTHDSIGLGEDGPTHQPVEHVAALRAVPNLQVFRPCDGIEAAECWELALTTQTGPSMLVLTRQNVQTSRTDSADNKSAKGAYVLSPAQGEAKVTIFASGSEVEIALEAQKQLSAKSIAAEVISVPCMELLAKQDKEYVMSMICRDTVKVAIEAGIRQGWDHLIGPHGIFIGMNSFGESAPASVLYKHFGITAEAVVEAVTKKVA